MFDVLLRLLVNLTIPPLILWNEEIPTDKTTRNYYLQIEGHLQHYKEAFADDAVWSIFSAKLSKILELEYTERGDEKGLVIERILLLIRNVLYVPSDGESEHRADNDANLHDQVLWALRQSGMLDLILYMSSATSEQAYYMHIIEVLSFLLREQSPQVLANSALERNHIEKQEDVAQLLSVRHQENNTKKEKLRKFTSARHSRFGGTFVVQSMKSIGDNNLIYHKPLNTLDKLDFDVHKNKIKTPKNRLPIKEVILNRSSAFSVRLFLKEFCIEFLKGAYNTFMRHVKYVLVRAGAETHDESYYLWALRFFMEFNRLYECEVKLVSETVSKETFHYVQQRMEHDFDMIATDKKKVKLWGRRLHLALLAYRELLLTLTTMDKSPDELVVESARIIKCNIFYVIEYRELILTLLITYDELKMSDLYLKDLIETQHVFLRMLETFCKKTGGVVVAEKKKIKKKKKKPQTTSQQPTLQDKWDEISPELSVVLASRGALPEVVPVDFTFPEEEQKPEAMKNIQRKLRNGELETAVALLRACREIWPANDTFGKNMCSPEEEYLIFQEIFFADLGEEFQEERLESESEEEQEEEVEYSETTLKFEDFCKRLTHPKIVRACALCLKNFATNSTLTNHCVVKLLHRIAFDCKMYVMVFQASIFRIFQKIFSMKEIPHYKELVKFATYITRQFFAVAEINPKVYIEVLFWKTSKDAFDIEHGYGAYFKKSESAMKAWSEAEEDELRTLYEEYLNRQIDEDVVDWITNNLVDNTKSRKAVLRKMKELGILSDYKPMKSGQKSNQAWTVSEENELKELFELHKDSDDPLGSIMSNLSINRPKNRIIEKLLVMGVIADRKELHKRRRRNKTTQSDDETKVKSNTTKTARKKPSQLHKKSKLKPRKKISVASMADSKKIIQEVNEKGFGEALAWIAESFLEVADDLENADGLEADGGIPLVPLMENCEAALEDVTFKNLLLSLGIAQPTDEQEVYWRIPNNLEVAVLRKYVELIRSATGGRNKEDCVDDGKDADPIESANEESNHSNDDATSGKSVINEGEHSNRLLSSNVTKLHNSSVKWNKAVMDSSDDERESKSNEDGVIMDNNASSSKISRKDNEDGNNPQSLNILKSQNSSQRWKKAILDSSEDETEIAEGAKRNRESTDSETDVPKLKKKRMVVVSSDEE